MLAGKGGRSEAEVQQGRRPWGCPGSPHHASHHAPHRKVVVVVVAAAGGLHLHIRGPAGAGSLGGGEGGF